MVLARTRIRWLVFGLHTHFNSFSDFGYHTDQK
jgi:hypothetical protein